jgi:prepilin-type N-terminal cleavage/methylation domain-containing protein
MRRANAFTLIEMMIVVVTLSILAVLVVPQLASATEEATRTSIRGQLQTIDKQVQSYQVAHDGALPTTHPTSPMGDGGANAGWGILVSEEYLKSAPANAYTGSVILTEGTFTDARDASKTTPLGWHYAVISESRLDIYAIGYDPDTDTLSHE